MTRDQVKIQKLKKQNKVYSNNYDILCGFAERTHTNYLYAIEAYNKLELKYKRLEKKSTSLYEAYKALAEGVNDKK